MAPTTGTTMRTHVEFRTTKFPSYDPEGEVNPGRYGQRLAEFLSENALQFDLVTVRTAEHQESFTAVAAEHFVRGTVRRTPQCAVLRSRSACSQ